MYTVVMVLGLINVQNFWMPDSSMGKNAIIFEVDMSSSVPINNKKKDILMIGKGLTQGLDDTTLTAELNIQLIFQDLCLTLIIMGATVFNLLILQKHISSKQKILK